MHSDAFEIAYQFSIAGKKYRLAPITADELTRALVVFEKYNKAKNANDIDVFCVATREFCEFIVETVVSSMRRASPETAVSAEDLKRSLTFHEINTLFTDVCRLETERQERVTEGAIQNRMVN